MELRLHLVQHVDHVAISQQMRIPRPFISKCSIVRAGPLNEPSGLRQAAEIEQSICQSRRTGRQESEGRVLKIVMQILFRAGMNAGIILLAGLLIALWASGVLAAPYAAMVMDARSGKVLHSRNADTQLHPASLTKMMTLYVAIEAVENGEIGLDTKVKISSFAAAEPPSKLYMKVGSRIRLRYLMRAAAIRSANDAATAIAEAISGSEANFAKRMTRTARAMGMKNTNFKNAHGLTQTGHYSTARDMSILGRHIVYDYPEYYNLFSRINADVGGKTVTSTNRRFLSAYRGADGIKTGYTRAAGFNLVASAKRGKERIIATVFGGKSTASRNKRVSELLDMGFKRAATNVALNKPAMPNYRSNRALADLRTPKLRPDNLGTGSAHEVDTASAIFDSVVASNVESLGDGGEIESYVSDTDAGSQAERVPMKRPITVYVNLNLTEETRYGLYLGRFGTKPEADKHLLKVSLMDFSSVFGATKSVEQVGYQYVVKLLGLTRGNAEKACARLSARDVDCSVIYLQ